MTLQNAQIEYFQMKRNLRSSCVSKCINNFTHPEVDQDEKTCLQNCSQKMYQFFEVADHIYQNEKTKN
jgi:hypothetical protein